MTTKVSGACSRKPDSRRRWRRRQWLGVILGLAGVAAISTVIPGSRLSRRPQPLMEGGSLDRWSPSSGCRLHAGGVVVPGGRRPGSLPYLFDTSSMPSEEESCEECRDTGLPPHVSCGVCHFEGRFCDAWYPEKGLPSVISAMLAGALCGDRGTWTTSDAGPLDAPRVSAAATAAAGAAATGPTAGGAMPTCLHDFTPCELFARIRGRSVYLVGDSQTWHFYHALECFLRDFAARRPGRPCRKALARVAEERGGAERSGLRGAALKEVVANLTLVHYPVEASPPCLELLDDTYVCAVRVDNARDMARRTLPALEAVEGPERFAVSVILFNTGLHYRSDVVKFGEDLGYLERWRARRLRPEASARADRQAETSADSVPANAEGRREAAPERSSKGGGKGKEKKKDKGKKKGGGKGRDKEKGKGGGTNEVGPRGAAGTGVAAAAVGARGRRRLFDDALVARGGSTNARAALPQAREPRASPVPVGETRARTTPPVTLLTPLPGMVWMDVPPQHFGTRTGEFQGAKSMKCERLESWYRGDEDVVGGARFNLHVADRLPALADARLATWNATAPLWDSHKPGECTHWCSPGAYQVWVALFNRVLAHDGMGNDGVTVVDRRTGPGPRPRPPWSEPEERPGSRPGPEVPRGHRSEPGLSRDDRPGPHGISRPRRGEEDMPRFPRPEP